MKQQLLIIAPTAPPEVCGASDYSYRTAQTLAKYYQAVKIGVERLPKSGASSAKDIAIEPWQRALTQAAAAATPSSVLLNYNPRSYAWSGWPTGLITALQKFKAAHPDNQFFLFVHEVWNDNRKLKPHHLIRNRLAKYSLHQLGKLADGVAVMTEGQQQRLQLLLQSNRIRLNPIGSNILPASKDDGLNSQRQPGEWVVFGLAHTRLWTLKSYITALQQLHSQGQLTRIISIGPTDNAYAEQEAALAAAQLGPGVLVQAGVLKPAEVSEQFMRAGAALVGQDADSLRKSSSFAALAAHAVPIICDVPETLAEPPGWALFRPSEVQENRMLIRSKEGESRRRAVHAWFWGTRSWEAIGQDMQTWLQSKA